MKRFVISILLLSLLIPMTACNDDDECPTCPEPDPCPVLAPEPTMANIWPHEDGTAWTFDGIYRVIAPPVPAKSEDTDLPTMEVLHAALESPMEGTVTEQLDGIYRIEFDGMKTTESGAEGQDLVETIFADPSDYIGPYGTAPDPLLVLIARARPDLRPAIAAMYGLGEKDFVGIPDIPFFLGSHCFSAEDEGYYAYGDIDLNHAWVYLEGDLSVGSEFSLQLVPALADDIWLYGKIWSLGDMTVNGQEYQNVLEAMYVVDMGVQESTDESGQLIATFRAYMYGNTHFPPEVGPIAGMERRVFGPDVTIEPGRGNRLEYIMDLVGVTYGE